MSTFNLGLPLDIPWIRRCYTEDMTHVVVCRDDPPPAWKPSIAIFDYEPDESYQTLLDKGYTISYLKVTVTITPDLPAAPATGSTVGSLKRDPTTGLPVQSGQLLQRTSPCYGALLHVSVGPASGGSSSQIYFADVEPTKRELYEAVTDTGQIASASDTRLSVGKSAMSSLTTENYAAAHGGVNMSIGIPLVGAIGLSDSSENSTRNTAASQLTDQTTTDRSTERRETQSHTTELSQMYHLFQAFHVGTNRAVFFMEPRPHIVQSEASFINGPRALEGMQDMFLVVVRPVAMTKFCVNARLETAHLNTTDVVQTDSDLAVFDVDFTADVPSGTGDDKHGYGETRSSYTPPPGWVIDVEKTRAEVINIIDDEPGWPDSKSQAVVEYVLPTKMSVFGKVSWHTFVTGTWPSETHHQTSGHLKFNITVHLKPGKADIREYVDQLYVNVRKLCCCPADATVDGDGDDGFQDGNQGGDDPPTPTPPPFDPNNPCTFIWDLLKHADPNNGPAWLKTIKWPTSTTDPHLGQEVANGTATPETISDSASMSKWMRDQLLGLLKMSTAPTWIDCPTPFVKSDIYFNRVTDALGKSDVANELERSIDTTSLLPAGERRALADGLGSVSLGAIVRTNAAVIAKTLGRPLYQVLQLKEQILSAVAAAGTPAMTAESVLGKVTGIKIGTTVPDPNNPRMLFEVSNPMELQRVRPGDLINVFDISFSDSPDEGTVSSDSIGVSSDGVAMTTVVRMISANTARVFTTSPLEAGTIYSVVIHGNGSHSITFDEIHLDGEPIALPSGNGVAGGNFMFLVQVQPEPPVGARFLSAPLAVTTVQLGSTWPNPSSPRTLALMQSPSEVIEVPIAEQPDFIMVKFNHQPDLGTVTSDSFRVTKDGDAIDTTVVLGSDMTATLKITDPIDANQLYVVTLDGTSSGPITYLGNALDGEPYALPSGDGRGGADFTFVFRAVNAPTAPTPSLPDARLVVVGVRMMSSTPDPDNPRLLAEMIHPGSVQIVNEADAPDIIEALFNEAPDSETVTDDSFTVGEGSVTMSTTISMPKATIARLKVSSPFEVGKVYTVTLKGTGGDSIELDSVPLDGDPLRLPSGDGTVGGDFTFTLIVAPAPPEISTLPLIKVRGVKLRSSVPDDDNPRQITRMVYANDVPQVNAGDNVDVIDIAFTQEPDGGTVTADTFEITSPAGAVAHTVAMLTASVARVTLADALEADTTYTITVKGEGSHAVKYQGRLLDGEALGFPSGNGVEGGDFSFTVQVLGG